MPPKSAKKPVARPAVAGKRVKRTSKSAPASPAAKTLPRAAAPAMSPAAKAVRAPRLAPPRAAGASPAVPPASRPVVAIPTKDLLGTENLSREQLLAILDEARRCSAMLRGQLPMERPLAGRIVANLFFENSTRTRTSFELAARHLGAEITHFDVATSSVTKGESLLDTVETIEALGAEYIVMRHASAGSAAFLARNVRASVINAGDGAHEHPTQALLDCFTIREHFGSLEGLNIAFVGDILHSRVARSNLWAMSALGAKITFVGAPTLVPELFTRFGVRVCHTLKEGIRGADVVYLLRIQLERQSKNFFPSLQEYRLLFGLDAEALSFARPGALVMHPGPVNRGIEVGRDILESPQCKISEQVSNGVAVRMAVLRLLPRPGLTPPPIAPATPATAIPAAPPAQRPSPRKSKSRRKGA